jgi:hypothetical protein
MALQAFAEFCPLFRFLSLYIVSRNPWTGDHTNCSEEFMKYAVEMGWGVMKYIPSFIETFRHSKVDGLKGGDSKEIA